ncbi:LysR family transcriptional regulator [Staphylococcus saprophyticus]|uniref:LysR family transcriptional regulator n=1 Tax=Staphylococcus saprophyticus TaxID=29385 RepID=UPI0009B5DFF5
MNRNYKYIETIINEGTITKAANKLYVSQPYLNSFIKNIEAEWNIIIFNRKKTSHYLYARRPTLLSISTRTRATLS